MGTGEIILIFLIYLIFFGAKGIPSLARNLGRTIRYFKDATNDIQNDIMNSTNDVRKSGDNIRKEIEKPFRDEPKNSQKSSSSSSEQTDQKSKND
ncbi:twin-arginine translocase TatA/TatE family subunit [Halocola ammonii]